MLLALRAKVAQHAVVRAALRSTVGAELVEHTRRDRYWGDGGDGSGANVLGRLWRRVRREILGRN
jgi:predicted NAD-dependent protein-ADP-ribosyltransferase YbiA (DUF1768 family)